MQEDLLSLNKCDLLDANERASQSTSVSPVARGCWRPIQAQIPDELLLGAPSRKLRPHGQDDIDHGELFDKWSWQGEVVWLQYVGDRYQLRPVTPAEAAQGSRQVFIAEKDARLWADLEAGLRGCFS